MSDSQSNNEGLELCVLASGSAGNSSAIALDGGGVLLIDAGIGPRVTGRRLAARPSGRRLGLEDVRAICLTHLDSDHFNLNWLASLRKFAIPVFCHASRARALAARVAERGQTIELRTFDDDTFEPVRGVKLRPIAFAHDDTGSHGFVITGGGVRIGYATDLGHVPNNLLECFCDLDLLAIESNYDRQMQVDSPRPWFLKNRIMNGSGHLSNAEAYALVRQLFQRCIASGKSLPRHVVLLHRSRECNCPDLLRAYFGRDARIASRLVLSEQHEPTPWLRAGQVAGEQMMLAWG
jgi:phosphoribosyl 1,2-cyclic phosphodiesterase